MNRLTNKAKALAFGAATVAVTVLPLTVVASPADAASAKPAHAKCATVSWSSDSTVDVGDSAQVDITLAKPCRTHTVIVFQSKGMGDEKWTTMSKAGKGVHWPSKLRWNMTQLVPGGTTYRIKVIPAHNARTVSKHSYIWLPA